jgi:superoxide dismutase, Fe-Mn family
MIHQLAPLPYAVDALEPHIDARTMTLHHDMHHAAYVKALNTLLTAAPADIKDKTPEWLMENLAQVPLSIRDDVRRQAGGHLNHSLLWTNMSPDGGGTPGGALAVAIKRDFDSIDAFRHEFEQAGEKHFGAGWVWLVVGPSPRLNLHILTTNEHDNPLSDGYQPLLVNDLWEHAYYLRHENRRPDYLHKWWAVVDWNAVADRLADAISASQVDDVPQGEAAVALNAVH